MLPRVVDVSDRKRSIVVVEATSVKVVKVRVVEVKATRASS